MEPTSIVEILAIQTIVVVSVGTEVDKVKHRRMVVTTMAWILRFRSKLLSWKCSAFLICQHGINVPTKLVKQI